MENSDFGDDDFMNEEFGAEEFESVFLGLCYFCGTSFTNSPVSQ